MSRLKLYIVFNLQFYIKIERDDDKMKNFDDENFDIIQSCHSHQCNRTNSCQRKRFRKNTLIKLIDIIHSIFLINIYVIIIKKKFVNYVDDEITQWKNRDEILWYNNRMYSSNNFRIDVIVRYHDDSLIDHFDIEKIWNLFNANIIDLIRKTMGILKSNIKSKNIVTHMLYTNVIKFSNTNYTKNYRYFLYSNIVELTSI